MTLVFSVGSMVEIQGSPHKHIRKLACVYFQAFLGVFLDIWLFFKNIVITVCTFLFLSTGSSNLTDDLGN